MARPHPLQFLSGQSLCRRASLQRPSEAKPSAVLCQGRYCAKGEEAYGKNSFQPGASKAIFAEEMQRLGNAWSCLSPTKKKDYVDRSKAEFDAQRLSLVQQGLSKRSCAGTAKLAAVVASEQETAKQDAPQENPAPSQSLQIGHYRLGGVSRVGKGAYGNVFLAMGQSGQQHAVKVFTRNNAKEDAQHEAEHYKILDACLEPTMRKFFPGLLGASPASVPFPWLSLS